jgi:hypothetical protein
MPIKEKSTLATTVHRLFYEKEGQIVVSALFGLALALVFRRVCKDNCTLYFAPNVDEVQNKTFLLEDTCYQYTPYNVKCSPKDKAYQSYDINDNPENKIIDYGLFSKFLQ